VYWELLESTDVLLRLEPQTPGGKEPLLSLIIRAAFPGRAERDPYSGQPRWPRGKPARLTITAEPRPLTVIRELSLRLAVDDVIVDLTKPGSPYRNIPCLVANEDCTPNGVEVEVSRAFLETLTMARGVAGTALGLPIRLTDADQAAVKTFLSRIGR
jgi:hypothetical protein